MRRLARLVISAGLLAAAPASGEQLVTALSNDSVSITSNFTGSRVVVFGTIERDAQTVSRGGTYEVVVILAGPAQSVVTRRKDRTFGIWINADSEVLHDVPSFYAVLSTSPLEEVTSDLSRSRLGIGLDMLPINAEPGDTPPVRTDFEEAFLRLMAGQRLYQYEPEGVEFLSAQLFRAPVALPATVPEGLYRATVILFRDEALLSTTTEELRIGKVGFEQLMTTFAREHGVYYGLAAVIVACLTGWLAGIIFRRD